MNKKNIREKYRIYLELCAKREMPEEYILSFEEYVEKIKPFICQFKESPMR